MYFGSGMVVVVGYCFDDDCYVVWCIIFIGKFDYVVGIVGVDVVCNGMIDGIVGYVGGQCFVYGQVQMWVVCWDVVVLFCSDGQFMDQFGKDFVFFGILLFFVVFDVGLFRMISYNLFCIVFLVGGVVSGVFVG